MKKFIEGHNELTLSHISHELPNQSMIQVLDVCVSKEVSDKFDTATRQDFLKCSSMTNES